MNKDVKVTPGGFMVEGGVPQASKLPRAHFPTGNEGDYAVKDTGHHPGEYHHKSFPYYHGLTYLDLGFSASYLRRFHMCRVQREQSLTDHSIRVGYVWRVLYERWKNLHSGNPESLHKTFKGFDFQQCELYGLKLAMDHDLAETLTGDVPSHAKNAIVKVELDKIEMEVLMIVSDGAVHLSHLTNPEEMARSEWRVAKALLKLADIAEGLTFSYYNQGLGASMPDTKSRWVNDNWNKIAHQYVAQMDSTWFGPEFKEQSLSWIVNNKMDVTPQHA
jgi:hypothetical protein